MVSSRYIVNSDKTISYNLKYWRKYIDRELEENTSSKLIETTDYMVIPLVGIYHRIEAINYNELYAIIINKINNFLPGLIDTYRGLFSNYKYMSIIDKEYHSEGRVYYTKATNALMEKDNLTLGEQFIIKNRRIVLDYNEYWY